MKSGIYFNLLMISCLLLVIGCAEDADINPGAGRGGSMAQFTVYNGQLYLLQSGQLDTYSLENPEKPVKTNSYPIGMDAETLFPSAGNLFVGSQNGMHILSLDNPAAPAYVSTYQHITSCDPVVVEGNYAYITLRAGSMCRFGTSELQVVNISDPLNPTPVYQMPMQNPQGLAVNEGTLYVCNGESGLVVLSVAKPEAPVVLQEYPEFNGYDVIFTTKSLMMIGEDGLVQYDPKDPANLKLLSTITVAPDEE